MFSSLGVYVHIPFCRRKCPYCDFNSVAVKDIPEERYIEALLREISFRTQAKTDLMQREVDTVYIGGGTPSLISSENIDLLLNRIQKTLHVVEEPEITLEVNPATVACDHLTLLRKAGINRLSIGVQSFSDKGLRSLGRIHTVSDAVRCYEHARKAGFSNIGIDLIFGLPGQTPSDWESELKQALSLHPEHISLYNLTVEAGTPFYRLQAEGRLILPPDETQVILYELGIDLLLSSGYRHYEISNFSLINCESRHNQRYWLAMDYLGLGAGAHSYSSVPAWGVRSWNESDPLKYMQAIENTGHAGGGMELLTKEEAVAEGIFLGLRRTEGIDIDWFSRRFSLSLDDYYKDQIESLKDEGFLCHTSSHLRLTRQGIILSNSVIPILTG